MREREQSAYRLATLIKRARRQMIGAIRAQLEPVGTSLQAVQILSHVDVPEDLNQLELARQIEQEPAALCRLIAELESQGLVARRRDPADNRRVLVTVTPAGTDLLADAKPKVLAGIEATISRLTRQEQSQLCTLLEKLAPDDEARDAGASEREKSTHTSSRARSSR